MVYPTLMRVMSEKRFSVTELLNETGLKRTSFYSKINGKTKFTLDEAMRIKQVLRADMPIELLFQRDM